MAKITITGIPELTRKLKKNATLNDVKHVVKKHGSQMQAKMVEKAPVDTGTLKRGIIGEVAEGGLAYQAGDTVHYGPYLEYGTRFMAAQLHIRPAFNEQKDDFKSDLKKLMK